MSKTQPTPVDTVSSSNVPTEVEWISSVFGSSISAQSQFWSQDHITTVTPNVLPILLNGLLDNAAGLPTFQAVDMKLNKRVVWCGSEEFFKRRFGFGCIQL